MDFETFINNYFLIILPNMFFAGTIIFTIANKWKSTVISFVGLLVIIIGYLVSGAFIRDIDNETIAALKAQNFDWIIDLHSLPIPFC